MADQLQIDLVFVANPHDALAALADINDAAEGVSKTFTDAFDTSGLSRGLEDAAAAVDRISDADLSGLEAAAGALVDAAVPADAVAAALAEAAIAAEGIGVAATVDPAGADQLAGSIDDAAQAATGVGESLGGATADADRLSDAMIGVSSSAGDTSVSVDDIADSLNAAADAAQETDNAISRVADAAREAASAQPEEDPDPAQPQREVNDELEKSGKLAGILQDQFVQIVDTAHSVLPSVRGITTYLLNAAKGVAASGPLGLATIGLAAGAATLLTASTQYRTATDQIVRATGASGAELSSLKDSFDGALRGSGKSAGDLAQILGQLNRDTGATGESLTKLTTKTASFLGVTGGAVGDVRTLTQAMKALGLGTTDMVGFQEKLVAAQKAFGGSIGSIISQVKTAGPALTTLGFDPGQIAGLVAQFDQAGLAVQRLVPGFSKLAKEATQHGETAQSAFGGLIDRIKGADSATTALSQVQGVFSGRVAQSFVTAVRNGTISIDEINKAMRESPGIITRLGTEMKGITGQFGQIRNELTAQLGQAGEGVLEGLRQSIEDVRPSISALIRGLGLLTPAFIGFAEALLLPVKALQYLERPLDMLATAIDFLPEPLIKLVGIFAAMRLIPFVKMGEGIINMATSLTALTRETIAATSARLAFVKVGDLASSLRLPAVAGPQLGETAGVAAAAVGTSTLASRTAAAKAAAKAAEEEAEQTARSAANRASQTAAGAAQGGSGGLIGFAVTTAVSLGILGITLAMDAASKKANELKKESEALGKALGGLSIISEEAAKPFRDLASNPEGGFLNQEDLERLAKGRETVDGLRESIAKAASEPGNIGEQTRRNMIADFGGIVPLIKAMQPGMADFADKNAETAGWAEKTAEQFATTGVLLTTRVRAADQIATLTKEGLAEANKAADTDIARLRGAQQLTPELEKQVLANLHLKDIKGNESKFLQEANRLLAEQLLLKHNIAHVDEAADARHAAFLTELSEQGLLQANIAKANDLRVKSSQEINEAMRDGVVTDKEWVVVNDHMTEAGFDQEEMVKGLKAAHEELQAVQAKYPVNTAAVDAAVTRTAQLMGQGFDKASALSQAAAELGVTIDKVDGPFSNFESKAKALGPALQVSDAASASLQRSMEDGVLTYAEQADLLAATGNNADMAARAIDTYNAGIEKTRAALDKLNPTMGETAAKLSDFTKLGFGPDMEAQNAAIEESANTRKAAIDAEIAGLETLKSAEGADTGSLQTRIDALKAQQDDIDGITERAKATLQVYDDLSQQARAKGALLTSDIDSQIAKATATRDAAAASAAASGRAFDPSAFDAQLAALQAKRDKAQTEMDATVARSQETSQQMLDAGANAVNGVLPLSETFQVLTDKYVAESTQFQGVAELRAQGLDDFLKVLFDPANAFSAEEIAARLKEAEEATPEQRTTIERNAESLAAAQKKALGDRDAVGDLFAQTNPKAVAGAEKLGTDTANSLTKGFLDAIEDGRFLELVQDLFSGQSPHDILEKYKPKGQAAAAGFLGSAEQQLLENPLPIETATTLTDDINRQLGVEGTAGGVNYVGDFDQHLLENPLPIETATSFTGPVTTQMSTEGEGGGFNWRSRVKGYIEENPLPSSTADAVVKDVNGVEGGSTGLWVGGWAGGNLYGKGLSAGVTDYTTSGAAFNDAFILGETLVAGGNTALGVHSPSVEGMKTGASWVEGIALGIESSTERAVKAATAVGDAVAAAILPVPAGIDSAAIAAATAAFRPLVGAGSLVGAQTGGQFSSTSAVQGSQGEQAPTVHIENVNVTGTTNATADEVAEAMSRKIGWLGITGRHEL